MKKLSFLAAILICGLICTTCDLFKDQVKEPSVTLDSINFSDINFSGLELLSNIKVENNMSVNIPFPKIDIALGLFDISNPFINLEIPSGGTLKSSDSTIIPVPTKIDFLSLFNVVAALTDKDKRENPMYKIKLTTYIPVQGYGEFTIPLEHEGLLPLIKVPDITFASKPKLSGDIIKGVKFDFSLNVKNNSNIAVIINAFSFVPKIDNVSLPSLGIVNKPELKSSATENITLQLSMTPADIVKLGFTIPNLLSGNHKFELNGDYMFGIPDFPLIKEFGDSFTLQ
jgi:LEA14-like dessication related protein